MADMEIDETLQLFLEVLLGQHGAAAFQALHVHGPTLEGELLDDRRGPLPELHGALGIDLVADGDDGGEVVVTRVVGLAVGGSYPKISDN